MKNTLKLGMLFTTILALTACGSDKKSDSKFPIVISNDEGMFDQDEVEEIDTMNGTASSLQKDVKTQWMKIDNSPLAFKETSSKAIWDAYNNVRLALIASDQAKAKAAAANLAMIFDESNAALKSKAEGIATTDDLEAQRKAFSEFSNAAENYFKKTVSAGTLYKQHCPMAFSGKGADWLSNEAAIKNPYYGDKMLNCGSVIATITK